MSPLFSSEWLSPCDISLSGFKDDELKKILETLEVRDKRESLETFDIDDTLEKAKSQPITKPGDLWILGDHRLLYGDSTNPEDVARITDGRKA